MDCIVHGAAKSWTRLNDFHRGWQCLTVPGAQRVLIKSMPYERVVQVLPAQGWQPVLRNLQLNEDGGNKGSVVRAM